MNYEHTGYVVSVLCSICGWLGTNIAIGLYVLDIWSVLCVLYVGGGISHSDRTVLTGHVVSVVCSVSGCWDLI